MVCGCGVGVIKMFVLCLCSEQSSLFVHRLIQHVVARQPLPPHRSQGAGLLSSVSGNHGNS